ncbi:MAG: hypothetical protein QHJ73_13420 [Armatimonadota bacterium]|nr:hypothetical protein [Armatimonadota bacterium]
MRSVWQNAPLLTALVATAANPAGAQSQNVTADRNGRILAMRAAGEYFPVATNLRVPLRGWGRQPSLADATDLRRVREADRTTWTGAIEVAPGKRYRFEQTLRENDGAAELTLRVTADAEVETEGVFFWADVPIELFAGGQCALWNGQNRTQEGAMPREQPQNRHFARGTADRVLLTDTAAATRLEMEFDRALPVVVQDSREFGGSTYNAFAQLAPALKAGESTALKVNLRLTARPDDTPARLTLHSGNVRYRLDGFGGNYCFNIESPVTQYTLQHLRSAWARTEMTLTEWEPENDNADPNTTDWGKLEARDRPDSNLRREFLLAKQLQEKGIPYVISIWDLPEWLYTDPGRGRSASRRKVNPALWDELLEGIGSYLVYAKRKYGVEPDLFSFNEPNIGVRVLFSPEEHRDAIKRIGAHLQALGLKTRMLLADATGPRGTHVYALPAAADPDAMRYVGAVGFHSWGGGSPRDYQAWANLAAELKLPLLVTELGVDAAAWRTAAYENFEYALREVQMYQELLLHARPQGTMQWEFTSDYSLLAQERDADGGITLKETPRYHFVRHFCNLTPRQCNALATESSHSKVLFTAFAGAEGARRVLTLHVANLGAGRRGIIAGIPTEVRQLRAFRTGEHEGFRELPPVQVSEGTAEVELAPLSLLTLTTMP